MSRSCLDAKRRRYRTVIHYFGSKVRAAGDDLERLPSDYPSSYTSVHAILSGVRASCMSSIKLRGRAWQDHKRGPYHPWAECLRWIHGRHRRSCNDHTLPLGQV